MTVKNCIERADVLKPNPFTIEDKIAFLNTLEKDIKETLLEEYNSTIIITPYTVNSMEITLAIPEDLLYITYLLSQYDFFLADFERYNNTASMFNTYLENYKRKYVKTHIGNNCKVGGF